MIPEGNTIVIVEEVDLAVPVAGSEMISLLTKEVLRKGDRPHSIPSRVAPARGTAVPVKEIDLVRADGDHLTVSRDVNREHPISGGVAPERGATVLVEQIDLVVPGARSDGLTILRDGDRPHPVPGAVAPKERTILAEEVDVVVNGACDDGLAVR